MRLQYQRPNRLSALAAELFTALPALAPRMNQQGELVATARVEGVGDDIWITVPDTVSKAAVDAVVAAHDPTKYDQEEQQQKQQRDADVAALRQYLTSTNANPVLGALIRRVLGE